MLIIALVIILGISGVAGVFDGGFEAVEARPVSDEGAVEILIGFESAPNPATYALIEAQGWKITGELPQINVLLVTIPTLPDLPELPEEAAARAEQALEEAFDRVPGVGPGLSFVEENGWMYAHGQTIPWGIERIDAVEAHNTSTGSGVGIAILDTGIDSRHEDLKVAGGYAVVSSRGNYPEPWDDDHGHGTHVAGTAAALDNKVGVLGVAPDVALYAVKVLAKNGMGTWADVAKGINWAADEGIEVLNMSLGGGHSDTVQRAVVYAYGKGSLLVASAGNSGPGEGTVGYPAAYPEVIAVSATDEDDNIANFSSRGEEIELAAPGVGIYSTLPGNKYGTYSGTSMAAPHVAGVAALVWATDSTLTNASVRGILQKTAEDIGLKFTEQGHGLVNAAAAVGIEPAEPEPYAVEITPSEQEGQAWPGENAVYEFAVENTGDTEDTYSISVSSVWTSSVEPESVTLEPGATATITVTHSVPEDAAVGSTDIGKIETVSAYTGASASASFTTTAQGYAVEITPSEQSKTGAPGDAVEYTYTISNTGTEDGSYVLEATSSWISSVDVTEVSLAAGDSADVTVTHTIPEGVEDGDSDTGTLTATSQADTAVSDSATFTTTTREEIKADLTIEVFDLTDTSNPAWARVTVEWTVSSVLGLATVKTEMILDGKVIDSKTSTVSGDTASGTHELRNRGGHGETYEIILTVSDTEGNTTSQTKLIDL